MKLVLKILAGFLLLLVLLTVALNLWFTDERLKEMIQPRIAEALNHDVEIDDMSLTVFRTFPNIGLQIEGFRLPKENGQPDISVERVTGSVRLLPLINQNIDISRLTVDNPVIVYTVHPDSSTNLDFLFSDEPVPAESGSDISLQIPRFLINNALVQYRDDLTGSRYTLGGLDSEISINYDERLESIVDASLDSLAVSTEESEFTPGFPISLHQVVSVDPGNKTLALADGRLSIHSMVLNLSGTIDYSQSGAPLLDLEFSSEADNFAELIELLPAEYRDHIGDTEASGALQLEGSVEGVYSPDKMPNIDLRVAVTDGYLNNPEIRDPLQNITLALTATNERVDLQSFSLEFSGNTITISGYLEDLFSDSPTYHMTLSGNSVLDDLPAWYPMEPMINDMAGTAAMNLTATGPLDDFFEAALNGRLDLAGMMVRGDSLALPVTDLSAGLTLSPKAFTLENYTMHLGSSDIHLEGSLENWHYLVAENGEGETFPVLSGSYSGQLLNLDELIDWDFDGDENKEYLIDLPDLTSSLRAEVDTMRVMGINVTELQGDARTTPEMIEITQAGASLFGGSLTGALTWAIPEPDHSSVQFEGVLENVQVQSLFGHFPILGRGGQLQEFVNGLINAEVEYYTGLNATLDPDVNSMRASGSFGISSADISGHPIQARLAEWLGADELNHLQLDDWQAEFTVENSVLAFENLRLTSDDIGLELSGTHHLVSDEIDFTAGLILPGRFSGAISSILPARAVELLTREDGKIVVPVRMEGSMEEPRISSRQQIVDQLLRETATNAARNLLDRLFNGN